MKNKNFIDLAKKLIRFQSTSNNKAEREKIVDFVVNYLKNDKIFVKKFCHNGIFSLVLTLKKNEKKPKVFMNGHLDVVGADKKDFTPKIIGNRIYGRGSADMKTQDAIMIEILRYFSKQKNPPSLGLMLVGDEEIGGKNGTNFLLNKKKYSCDLAIIPDGGQDLSHLLVGEKGILHLKITFSGKSAHGARPFLGDNALDHLIKSYNKIRKIFPLLSRPRWKRSLNLGIIKGGTVVNKVPDKAEMFLDIRFVKIAERELILKKVEEIIKGENGKMEILAEGFPMIQNPNNAYIRKWINIAEEILNKKIVFQKDEGASDARFFKANGAQVIMTRPIFANNHSPNEWIDIKESMLLYEILEQYIELIFQDGK